MAFDEINRMDIRSAWRSSFSSITLALCTAGLCVIGLGAVPVLGAPEAGKAGDAELSLHGLALRSIGPAVMGGRIADIAVDPRRPSTWYLAVGSGGVWKTENAGTTWTPIFDDQPSYSIGCVTLDPNRPDVVWVGTGENVSGRHVGWGDGVYRSLDGGASWRQMGLEGSEHIGDIVVDPRDSRVIYVAAEGPLWSSGGERGLYKSTDGGESWARILEIDEDTGITDIEIDPRNPDVIYAASYERRRRVWAFLAGGPGSGIHKSTDGGATWRRLGGGLPSGDMGKIGLAVSPADPDVVYATVEAGVEERGFYRSSDRGESWTRRSSYLSGGTGPHYYQEIVASPHDVQRVYQMDVFLHTTADGGATMEILGDGRQKHSDNHALWIDPENFQHLLAGTDGGLYETFDHGTTWRHFGNLPIAQFYKLAVEGGGPFYRILGGAQDLGTLLGPSRTRTVEGAVGGDWSIPMGADGYACAFDPEISDLLYVQWQVGNLHRYDLAAAEALDIQPQPAPGDEPERWNWDAPLITSPHAPGRLYYGSQRVWQSEDRGGSWTAISGDLTHAENRYELEMIDRVPGTSELYDNGAMSWYATLTALSESPLVEGLLYAGSDDGRIQVRDPADGSWRLAGELPGVPRRSFVQEVTASLHGDDTVFAVLDAHKIGDYRPLLLESRDRGASWRSMAGDPDAGGLPAGGIVWSIVQDHEAKDLFFVGTEFGLFFTTDRGRRWRQLKAGLPTIALRDLEIQRGENDLVAASFGRGFYVLDDYSPLRHLGAAAEAPGTLFPVRRAWSYIPEVPMQAAGRPSQGSAGFVAPNPPFGAVFNYALAESGETSVAVRRSQELELREKGEDAPFPGWAELQREALEKAPVALLTVRDAEGKAVRRLEGPAAAGLHRVSWDLRWPAPDPINLETPGFRPPWVEDPKGPLVAPGTYRAELAVLHADGRLETLGEAQSFEVAELPERSLPAPDASDAQDFRLRTRELLRRIHGAAGEIDEARRQIRHLREAITVTPGVAGDLHARLQGIEARLAELGTRLSYDGVRGGLDEPSVPTIAGRASRVAWGLWDTREAPTSTQRTSLDVAVQDFETMRSELSALLGTELAAIESELEAAGAPWTPGRSP